MAKRVTLIQGGGVGLDLVPAMRKILKAAGVEIEWDEQLAGGAAEAAGKPALSPELLASVRANGLALKTKLLPSPRDEHINYNIRLRKELGLFASVRPLKNLPGLKGRFENVDLMIVRETTEDLYASIEHVIVDGVVQSLKVVTEAASKRFFRFAFELTRSAGRKTIHCVHKANILKLADGLVLEAFRAIAKDFPDIQAKEIIVDNCCMQMVSKPTQFDVLAMGNLYGDIVSDLGAGLVGGVSATHAINFGEGIRIFEAFHGGKREEIGENRANPLPMLLPTIDLVEALGQKEQAARIQAGLEKVLKEGKLRPDEIGGHASTTEMADAIIAAMA
jgi:isocitrate dehydrogenase (NAD+)